jgi:hypothetical protein
MLHSKTCFTQKHASLKNMLYSKTRFTQKHALLKNMLYSKTASLKHLRSNAFAQMPLLKRLCSNALTFSTKKSCLFNTKKLRPFNVQQKSVYSFVQYKIVELKHALLKITLHSKTCFAQNHSTLKNMLHLKTCFTQIHASLRNTLRHVRFNIQHKKVMSVQHKKVETI